MSCQGVCESREGLVEGMSLLLELGGCCRQTKEALAP